MKQTIIKISVITSLVLSLNASTIEPITNWTKYPLPQEVVSKSKGGTLADKLAMKDGVGSIIIKSINGNSITLNNDEYNKLLLLNKDKLTDTIGLKELIASGDIVVDSSTLNSINGNGLSNPTGLPVDGTPCNDSNPLTTNDIYTNNVCLGTSIVGKSCDDNNANTSDDKYDNNGVCVGTLIELVFKSTSTNLVNGFVPTIGDFNIMIAGGASGPVSALFNNVIPSSYSYLQVTYLYQNENYFILTFNEPFRIWRTGVSGYQGYYNNLKITNVLTNQDVSSYNANPNGVSVGSGEWTLMTNELPAGTYRFGFNGYHMSGEWFVEKKVQK